MRTRTRGGATATAVALCTLGLIGCSSTTPGTPAPTGTQASNTAVASSGSQNPSATGNALASLNACDLLTSDEAAPYKPQQPGTLNTTGSSGAASDCEWRGQTPNGDSMGFGVLVRPTQGVNDINGAGGKLTHGDANGRPAGQFTSNIGGKCLIALGVSPTSRVDVSVVIGGAPDPTEACQIADDIATHVEPRIPKYTG